MSKTNEPTCVSFHVDPSPHYPDDYPVKDNYYHRVIKAGDKIRFWLSHGQGIRANIRTNFFEGVIEEIGGILWVHVQQRYTSSHGYEPVEIQGPFRLINNFINRCYAVVIIDEENTQKLKPIKKSQGGKI